MRIGIDLDGTIVDTYRYWLQVLAQTHLAGRFQAADLLDHHSDPDLYRYVEEHAAQMFGHPPAMPGALEVLARLQEQGHDLWFISARNEGLRPVTEAWLARHKLPVERLHLLAGGDKATVCLDHAITVMFEDSPSYSPILAAHGVTVWLLDTEYNRHVQAHGIRRFHHWGEVLQAPILQAPA
jgi:uncharacterized HAD superfamily protein